MFIFGIMFACIEWISGAAYAPTESAGSPGRPGPMHAITEREDADSDKTSVAATPKAQALGAWTASACRPVANSRQSGGVDLMRRGYPSAAPLIARVAQLVERSTCG